MTTDKPLPVRPSYEALRKAIERPTECWLWGNKYTRVPRLVEKVFGDGEVLMTLTFFYGRFARPRYVVVRVDSSWYGEYWEDGAVCDNLDDIFEAIEEQFSPTDCSGGCMWGKLEWPI